MRNKYEYDSIVIGGGAAGLTASGISANFGAKTMMIEADRLGGDCTWTGCIPSKTLLHIAGIADQIKVAAESGFIGQHPEFNFEKVMEHVRRLREEVYEEADKPEIFEKQNVEVIHGKAGFKNTHTIDIAMNNGDQRTVTSRYFFICTGGSPSVPPVDGIEGVEYLTNETIFELRELPEHLLIIGAGPIGTEMAQAFNRLGSRVTVIDMAGQILTNDDPELAGMLKEILEEEGIGYHLGVKVENVSQQGDKISVTISEPGGSGTISGTSLLMATGRKPNVKDLNLDAAGVEYTRNGISVSTKCRTNHKHIYACGDVTGRYQFTHMSEHMAKVATTNALLKFPMHMDEDQVPWVTYTTPEMGHVGATTEELDNRGISYETYRFPYSKVDRAFTESATQGLIKVYAKKWSGKILGADILGAHAGELISEYALAMRNGVSLREMADTIHPYPSYALGARRAADQWYIKNQREWQSKLIKKLFGYSGKIPDLSDPDRIV